MDYKHERPSVERSLPKRAHVPMPKQTPELWPKFDEYLLSRGLNPDVARTNRWYPSVHAGDTNPRIVIPATNSNGSVYWQARAMVSVDRRYQSPPVWRGDSIIVAWPVGDLGLDDPVVVVEGPMDALAAASAGYVGIALMGKAPGEAVLNHVAGYLHKRPVLVVADSDAVADASRIAAALAARGRRCRIMEIRPNKDLAETPVLLRQARLDAEKAKLKSRSRT